MATRLFGRKAEHPGTWRARSGRRGHGRFIAAVLACTAFCAWAVAPVAAAAPLAAAHSVTYPTGEDPQLPANIEPQVCASCTPPLQYGGGPVLSTNGAKGLTITPVWWQSSGSRFRFPSGYEAFIERFIRDISAASGSSDNVFSIDTEYYDMAGGAKTYVTYKFTAGKPVVDTDAYPANGCKEAPGFSACITDGQIRNQLKALTSSQKLPTTMAYFYPVFFPPGVETEDIDGSNSASAYCGYHRAFGSGSNQTVYGDMPYPPSNGGCDTGQAPNGNLRYDGEVSTFAHELNEAITDPLNPQYAWFDGKGNEIGDMCDENYGGALGSTNPSSKGTSEYNQVINGDKYYLQEFFSNLSFHRSGVGKGCALSEAIAENPKAAGTGTGATTIGYEFADAYPTTLAANGKSTSTITVAVGDEHGDVVQSDHVHFTTGLEYGTGLCGKLSSHEADTNADGYAKVTYTASKFNSVCWVVATEADGGKGSESIIYQGTARSWSPSLVATFPSTLHPGSTATFTMTAANPSPHPLANAQDYFTFYGEPSNKNVDASQVHLSYSTHGDSGHFTKVNLSGSTGDGNAIEGYVGSAEGATMAPHSSQKITFHISVARDVPILKSGPLFAIEGYLDQVNSAAGGGATVGDTLATDVTVP